MKYLHGRPILYFQRTTQKTKAKMRIENEEYLRDHPELQTYISTFMSKGDTSRPIMALLLLILFTCSCCSDLWTVLAEQPDDVLSFACNFFSDPDNETLVMESVGTVGFTA